MLCLELKTHLLEGFRDTRFRRAATLTHRLLVDAECWSLFRTFRHRPYGIFPRNADCAPMLCSFWLFERLAGSARFRYWRLTRVTTAASRAGAWLFARVVVRGLRLRLILLLFLFLIFLLRGDTWNRNRHPAFFNLLTLISFNGLVVVDIVVEIWTIRQLFISLRFLLSDVTTKFGYMLAQLRFRSLYWA